MTNWEIYSCDHEVMLQVLFLTLRFEQASKTISYSFNNILQKRNFRTAANKEA